MQLARHRTHDLRIVRYAGGQSCFSRAQLRPCPGKSGLHLLNVTAGHVSEAVECAGLPQLLNKCAFVLAQATDDFDIASDVACAVTAANSVCCSTLNSAALVEQSHLPVKRTLAKLGIPRATFYRWYDHYQAGGPEALDDRSPRPDRVWNRIPDNVREKIKNLALEESALSPRELAVRFTDTESYFVSEASVYRLLKALDLIASPAYIVMKAAAEFKDKTTAPNQLWQTDFTYLKVIGWGWYYLSTILDDFSRFIIAWKLCTSMTAEDVTATLDLALKASGLDRATVVHRPRLLSDNGSSYVSAAPVTFAAAQCSARTVTHSSQLGSFRASRRSDFGRLMPRRAYAANCRRLVQF